MIRPNYSLRFLNHQKIHQQSKRRNKKKTEKCIISFYCAIKRTDIKEVQGIVAKLIEKKRNERNKKKKKKNDHSEWTMDEV